MSLSTIAYKVSVPVKRDGQATTNYKGKTFENLVAAFLKLQNYKVIQRIREVGSEVDLLCTGELSNDTVIVECKAHERPLQSEIINKLFADIPSFDGNAGWIFSTSELGIEARRRLEKLNEKAVPNYMRFFSGDDLVKLLLKSSALKLPTIVSRQTTNEYHLCLFDERRIWAVPILDEKGQQPIGCLAFDGETGAPLIPESAPDIRDSDFTYAEFGWLSHISELNAKEPDTQPIIDVIPGDEWSDYRPARPGDFVGRTTLIGEVSDFFKAITKNETPSRIFGIKGRSGWGKSSLAIKLADSFAPSKMFVLPVDCRAANTSLYPDLAIARALSAAAKIFHGPLFAPRTEFRTNPFEDESVSRFLRDIGRSGGLICIIFDQFEAIIHRTELRPVFDRLKTLALFADELRGPFVIGFSWKTDGTISSDNPGYHLWHSLADRRRDFEIDRFTREDADQFMSLALKSAHVQLPKAATQFILEQYAGYPWLLKKLIKHCVDYIKKHGTAAHLGSFFDVASLFKNDLQELSASEVSALKFIAGVAPVELHIAEEKCGTTNINNLIERRLLIKTGSQLSLYWDTFRDYILYNQVPQLPNTYIPTISVRKIRSVIRLITQSKTETYDKLANTLGVSHATADNTVRDLSNMGLVASNRIEGSFTSNCSSATEATEIIVRFLKSHAVFIKAKFLIESESNPTLSKIQALTVDDFSFLSIDRRTLRTYVRKIVVYCLDFGLLERKGSVFHLGQGVRNILEVSRQSTQLSDDDIFRGAAPPDRVIELLEALRARKCRTLTEATEKKLRNAVYAASRLGLVEHRGGKVIPISKVLTAMDVPSLVLEYAQKVEPIHTVFANTDVETMSVEEVGTYLSDRFELNWSPASCLRYGVAIKDWCMWIKGQTQN